MTDADLLRELRLLVDRAGGGIGLAPDAVYRYVLESAEACRHETAMHDGYQKHARRNGWTLCSKCYQPFGWPGAAGLVADGGKARAVCRRCIDGVVVVQSGPGAFEIDDWIDLWECVWRVVAYAMRFEIEGRCTCGCKIEVCDYCAHECGGEPDRAFGYAVGGAGARVEPIT